MSKLNDKYPNKRGYAIGKLQKFLAEANLTDRFRENVKRDKAGAKGNRTLLEAFTWFRSSEGYSFWENVDYEFQLFKNTGKIFHVYED